MQIGAAEDTPDGYSYLDAAAEVPDAVVPFVWVGIEGDPTTTLHIHIEALDGQASYEDGCGVCVGVEGRVLLVVDTDDGFLDESIEGGFLTIVPGESATLSIVSNSLDEFAGSLPAQTFDQVTDNAGIDITWDLSDPRQTPLVTVSTPGPRGAFVIGENDEG